MIDYQIFWGGTDVNPALYKQPKHHTTQYPDINRDTIEAQLFRSLVKNSIPMVGICRGSQFLNVMNGGSLIQDVRGHTNDHIITDLRNNEQFWVTSTHHQMMVPHKDAEIIAIDQREVDVLESPLADNYVKQHGIEVVFYPKTKCLCIQFHPEYMTEQDRAVSWTKKLANDLLEINLNLFDTSNYCGAY